MKKVIFSLPLLVGLLFGAQSQKMEDCVEVFQNEITQIVYSNAQDKEASIEALTKKLKTMFGEDCDINSTRTTENVVAKKNAAEHVIVLDTTKKSQDCVESFQNDLRDILYSNNNDKQKAKKIKLVIKGDKENCDPVVETKK